MNLILFQKQKPICINTKSVKKYPNISAQTSEEFQPLEKYENSINVCDDMLLWKQAGQIHLFFTTGHQNKIDIYYKFQRSFRFPKNIIRNKSTKLKFFKQTPRDIILLFHQIAGLDTISHEWKQLCHKAWENEVTIYGGKLVFRISGKISTLKMITD